MAERPATPTGLIASALNCLRQNDAAGATRWLESAAELASEPSTFIAVACSHPAREGYHLGAVTLTRAAGATEGAVAADAADWMERESSEDLDADYLKTIYLVPVHLGEVRALNREAAYELATGEFACCGGQRFTEDGHSAYCPNHTDTEEPNA